uniref:hypothetical protein n=1 Tax=Lactobacillus delbrueckii TaxID=1584 RepID=UPI0038B9F0A2
MATNNANRCQAATLIATGFNGVESHKPTPKINGRAHAFHFTLPNIFSFSYLSFS